MDGHADLLLGREEELRLLDEAIGNRGSKRAVIFRGEPGVGKSALLNHAHAQAKLAGYVCTLTRTPASGSLSDTFPIHHILRGLADGIKDAGVDLPPALRAVADARPGAQARARSLDLLPVAAAVEEAGSRGSLAIFLDDLQWIPGASLDLLYASLRVIQVPILLVGTFRRSANTHEGYDLLPEPSADLNVMQIDVKGLDVDACHVLASRELSGPVLPSVTTELYERSRGNPLFLLETIRSWRHTGAIVPVTGGYWGFTSGGAHLDSPSLIDLISRRLTSMSAPAIEIARALAVLERPAGFDELSQITGQESISLADSLDMLESGGFVEADPSARAYRLAHPLFQSTLLSSMGTTRKAAMHDRIYSALATGVDRVGAHELAHHAVNALRPPADLASLLQAAAQEAQDTGSYFNAAHWYERLGKISPEAQRHAMPAQGMALVHVRPADAIAVFDSALPLAKTPDERALILLGKSRALRIVARPEEALDALEEAASIATGALRNEIRDAKGAALGSIGRIEEAVVEFESVAKESEGTPLYAKAVGHLGNVAYVEGRLDDAVDLMMEALAASTDAEQRTHLQVNLGWFLVAAGRWQEAQNGVGETITKARRSGDMWALPPLIQTAVQIAVFEGDLDAAMDLVAELQRLDQRIQIPIDRLVSRECIGRALIEAGDYAGALSVMADVPTLLQDMSDWNEVAPTVIAFAEAHLGDARIEEAKKWASEAREYVKYNRTWSQSVDRLDAQIALTDGRFEQVLETITPWLSDSGPMPLEQAWMYELAAQAKLGLGLREEALQEALAARATYERLGARPRAERVREWIAIHAPRPKGRPRSTAPDALTERELEILRLIVTGKTNREISETLTISSGTVKKHVENMKLKLGARRRTELVVIATRLQL